MLAHLSPVRLGTGAALWLLLVPFAAPAQDQARVERELADVRARIEALSRELASTRRREAGELARLEAIDREVADVARSLRRTDEELAALTAESEALAKREAALTRELEQARQALAGQVRAAYSFGRQPALRLLFAVDDPARLNRLMTYYRHVSEAQARGVDSLRQALAELDAVRDRSEVVRRESVAARDRLDERRDALGRSRREREAVVAGLRQELRRDERALAGLDQDQRRLVGLLEQLERLLADLPGGFTGTPFSALEGRLAWPVRGSLSLAPGIEKPNGMRRQGALISASAGAPVRAVSYGRVAFADWLRGFGLLVVLDHGEDYMSLYGFNQSVLVDVGDWVEAGDAIAEVGRSGAQRADGLYFEIRREGQPVDPRRWFAEATPDR